MAEKPKHSEEFDRFTALVDQVISVPKAEIQKRQEVYQRESKANPKRRGPKRKAKQNDNDPNS